MRSSNPVFCPSSAYPSQSRVQFIHLSVQSLAEPVQLPVHTLSGFICIISKLIQPHFIIKLTSSLYGLSRVQCASLVQSNHCLVQFGEIIRQAMQSVVLPIFPSGLFSRVSPGCTFAFQSSDQFSQSSRYSISISTWLVSSSICAHLFSVFQSDGPATCPG